MTISFPRAMPASGVGEQRFELQRVQFLSPTNRGRIGAMEAGFPLWSAEWSLAQAMGQDLSDTWRAWIAAQEGPRRLFLGFEYGREYPRAYPTGFGGLTRAGGGSFDGSATSWSQTTPSDGPARLTLAGLPAGLVLAAGDYVDFRWTTGGEARRALVRLLEPVTANVGGGAVVSISPAVPAITPGGAVAHLDNPACLMRLTPDSQVTAMDRRKVAGARLTAIQDLLP